MDVCTDLLLCLLCLEEDDFTLLVGVEGSLSAVLRSTGLEFLFTGLPVYVVKAFFLGEINSGTSVPVVALSVNMFFTKSLSMVVDVVADMLTASGTDTLAADGSRTCTGTGSPRLVCKAAESFLLGEAVVE